ncbi:DUF3592 domain-containing protein [Streptomyces sp. NPDC097610]|uniref:DUF3592 domain-containing protein n=1 Tax=Streptomyces sp. NPDC097610 TaxID=3157227 RepID=UPI003317F69D
MLAIRMFLLIALFVPLLVVCVNLFALLRGRALESAGGRTVGVCVEHFWPAGGYVGAVVRYSPTGDAEFLVRSSKYATAPCEVDDEVEVYYDRRKPGRAMISFEAERRIGYDTLITSAMGVLVVGAILGLVATG